MIKIYNTLTGKKEELKTITPGEVKMYVCGVTVYDYSHLGHARGALAFEIVRNYLEYRGYKVTYVRNFTDIDDKIINRANQEKTTEEAITSKYIQEYHIDMEALGIKKATIEPKATENVKEIIDLVAKLIERGYAYALPGGDVFFEVAKFNGYGKLSGRNLEDMKAGARIEIDPRKKSPLDFAVWKSAKPGEPKWETPWGAGRPGWHIECSAMSMKYLGESFDIHGGGKDLIFPHHENEIAQSEACTNKPFSTYWMHNGFVNIDNEKMSKSLGNFFRIRDILDKYNAEVVRFFLLSTHYRSPIDFSDTNLKEAGNGLERVLNSLSLAGDAISANINLLKDNLKSPTEIEEKFLNDIKKAKENFIEAMDDDFNTAQAIAFMFDLIRQLNSFLQSAPTTENKIFLLSESIKIIKECSKVLNLFQKDNDKNLGNDLTESLLEIIVELRIMSRTKKDWAMSDFIRDKLKEKGIELEDGKEGTRWKIKK